MLRVDVIKQQHHHGETHGKGAGVLKIRLQKFPHRLRMRAGQLQSAAKAVAHRPIIYFWHESSGAGQNLLRRRADSTNDHSLQHDFFKRAVSCGIQIGGPIPLGNAARKAAQQGKAHAQHVFRAGQKPAGKNGVFRFGQADKFSLYVDLHTNHPCPFYQNPAGYATICAETRHTGA